MADDVFSMLGKIAPWIAAAAEGPPGLIAMAAKTLGGVTGQSVEPTKDGITAAVANVSDPQVILQIKQADNSLQAQMQQAGFTNAKDMRLADIQEQQIYVSDTADARHAAQGETRTFYLGVIILVVFTVLMGAVLWAAFAILVRGIDIKDPGTVAVVFTLVGTIVGYVAALAQQVSNFNFGSSKGSADKSTAMASAVKAMGAKT